MNYMDHRYMLHFPPSDGSQWGGHNHYTSSFHEMITALDMGLEVWENTYPSEHFAGRRLTKLRINGGAINI